MNIIHMIPDVDKEASGPTYSVRRLCESLIEKGNNVRLGLLDDRNNATCSDYVIPFSRGFGPTRLGRSPEMMNWLVSQVNSDTVDIVHSHSLWMMPNIYPGWATRNKKLPYVVSPRGTLSPWAMASGSKFKRTFWSLLQRPSIAHAALFHATAESEYFDIRRMGFKQPIAIIPNGIDIPKYNFKPPRQYRTVLFLGRLHPVKGIESLLRAWRNLQEDFPDWRLQVVGPGDEKYASTLKSLSDELALDRVSFPGPLYGQDKFEAYRNSDIYVLPSRSENFGMTVAESLSCGTPCVVTQGAPWRGLEETRSGWWPDLSDSALLQSLRQAMSKSQGELDAMGENGRLWMARDFSWNHIGTLMNSVYEWVLRGGPTPESVRLD